MGRGREREEGERREDRRKGREDQGGWCDSHCVRPSLSFRWCDRPSLSEEACHRAAPWTPRHGHGFLINLLSLSLSFSSFPPFSFHLTPFRLSEREER